VVVLVVERRDYYVNFGTAQYEDGVPANYFFKTAVSDRRSISLVCIPTAVFQRSYLKIWDTYCVVRGQNRSAPANSQLPTPTTQ
jgi:hypothetical protein